MWLRKQEGEARSSSMVSLSEDTNMGVQEGQGTWCSKDKVPEVKELHRKRAQETYRGPASNLQPSTDELIREKKIKAGERITGKPQEEQSLGNDRSSCCS